MNVLLTGGSGFLGKNILDYYREVDDICIDAPSSLELDCLDEQAVKFWLSRKEYDVVLNFAGYSPVASKIERDANKIFEYNMKMFMNFAKYSHLYKRMFWTGSGAEYDRNEDISCVKEDDILDYPIPRDQYGFEKYCIGRFIDQSDNIYNLRIFGIFGPYEFAEKRFISNMIIDAIRCTNFCIRQNSKFDFLWIGDFLHILDLFIRKDDLSFHTYNVASGNSFELLELAKIVKKVTKSAGDIIIQNDGMGKEYTVNISRLMNQFPELRFSSMDSSIDQLYQWYLKRNMLII